MCVWNFEKPQLHVYTQNTALQPTTWSVVYSMFLLNWYIISMCQIAPPKWWMEIFFIKGCYNRGKDVILKSHSLLNYFAHEWDFSWLQKITYIFKVYCYSFCISCITKTNLCICHFQNFLFSRILLLLCEKRRDEESRYPRQ